MSISEISHMTSHQRHMGDALRRRKATQTCKKGICMSAFTHGHTHIHIFSQGPCFKECTLKKMLLSEISRAATGLAQKGKRNSIHSIAE